ncbi:HotDog domain [Trinorchestia longiramus]|nr:HotDog domain [Trinorchestia longiramus]
METIYKIQQVFGDDALVVTKLRSGSTDSKVAVHRESDQRSGRQQTAQNTAVDEKVPCFVFAMGYVEIAVVVLASIEVGYFLKTFVWTVGSRLFRSRIHPLQYSSTYGIVTTRDIDLFLTHLNNSRFLRAMDFGRFDHIFRTNLSSAISKTKSQALVASSTIRYRKPLYVFLPYAIDTGVVYWDSRSVYYRQDVRSLHDNFIRGTAYLKVTMVGTSPAQLFEHAVLGYTGPLTWTRTFIPPPSLGLMDHDKECKLPSDGKEVESFLDTRIVPSDLQAFLRFNEESSLRIKASLLVKGATEEAVKRLHSDSPCQSSEKHTKFE